MLLDFMRSITRTLRGIRRVVLSRPMPGGGMTGTATYRRPRASSLTI